MNWKKLGYWASTGLLAFFLLANAAMKLSGAEPLVESMKALGYPTYLLTILGSWYLAGAIALLAPGFAKVKEWAYAGITFAFTGAFASHVLAGEPIGTALPAVVALGLAAASYLLLPARTEASEASAGATQPVSAAA